MAQTQTNRGFLEWLCCPVCDGDKRSEYVAFSALTFSRCTACSAVYKSKEEQGLLPARFYEQGYFQGRKSGRDQRFERRVRKAMGEIADGLNVVGGARSVLDVGCSLGYVLEAGRRLGLQSTGLDISQHAVKVCRERGFTAEVGTLDALPFADGTFDLVVMKHVLEHTPQPQTALGEVHRVLRLGGAVVIAVPNVDYWKGDQRRTQYRYYRPDDLGAQHYVYYSEDTLCTRLARSGFEVVTFGKTRTRQALAQRSGWWAASEPVRAWALRWGRAAGRKLKLQREVYVVAQRA